MSIVAGVDFGTLSVRVYIVDSEQLPAASHFARRPPRSEPQARPMSILLSLSPGVDLDGAVTA